MIAADEDALICDLAEVYHIYDYRSLPAGLVATFSVGLREDSRIKMKLRGEKARQETILLALIHDRLMDIAWRLCGANGKPDHIIDLFLDEQPDGQQGFDTPEAYEAARHQFIEGG